MYKRQTRRSLLTNEKYKGDALLQKTYRPSLFSDRAVQNNGDLPKYYVEGVLPRILEPDMFDRVQEEMAKRRAKRPTSEKAKTPFGRYSGKYALSALVMCAKCGALYRRVTWYRKGEKPVSYTHLDVYKRQPSATKPCSTRPSTTCSVISFTARRPSSQE